MKFPVKIAKGEFTYQVEDQAALDFHLAQGWELLQKEGTAAVVVAGAADDVQALREQVAAFAGIASDLEQKVSRLEQGMAMLSGVVSDHADHIENVTNTITALTAAPPEPQQAAPQVPVVEPPGAEPPAAES